MTEQEKKAIIEEFMRVPGMTSTAAESLYGYGIRSVQELKGKNPLSLYEDMSKRHDIPPDQCTMLLNALRLATHFSSREEMEQAAAYRELKKIPGMIDVAAEGLVTIGIKEPRDLKGRDPDELYEQVFAKRDIAPDICSLALSSIHLGVKWANDNY
jgi:hypothetical protein